MAPFTVQPSRPLSFSALVHCVAATALASAHAAASDAPTAGLYDITVETTMPHLEENLRYTIEREERCLTREQVFTIFPVLRDAVLTGCKLSDERRHNDVSTWTLICTGGHGTTGRATWRLGTVQLVGQLDVKLGGKNMTFYQRATLKRLRDCN
jgi:hypothetical protein